MKKIKAAILCSGLESVKRGFETHSRTLFDSLASEAADQIDVFLFKRDGEKNKKNEVLLPVPSRRSVLCKVLGKIRGCAFYWEHLFFGLRFLAHALVRRKKFDCLLTIEPAVSRFLYRLRSWLPGNPRIIFTHGVTMDPIHYVRISDEICESNIENYERIKTYIESLQLQKKVSLLPFFVQSNAEIAGDQNKQLMKEKWGIKTSKVLLSVGIIDRSQKRMDYLINEVKKLPDDWTLLLCGYPAEPDLIHLAKSELGERFVHVFVDRKDLESVYAAADVFVLGSIQEGFGIVIIEAMRAGLPVLLHERKLFRWILGTDHCTVDMNKAGSVSEFINEKMLRDAGWLERQGRINRERFEANFSWEAVKEKYLDLLVLTGRTSGEGLGNESERKEIRVGFDQYGYPGVRNIYGYKAEGVLFKKHRRIPLEYVFNDRSGMVQFSYFPIPRLLNRPDFYHTWNRIYWGKRPWGVSFESYLPRYFGNRRHWVYRRALERLTHPQCRFIIAISEHAKQLFFDSNPECADAVQHKVHVIYPFQEPCKEALVSHKWDRPSHGKLQAVFVGRDFFRKGGIPLVRAIKRLFQSGSKWNFTIVSALAHSDYVTGTTRSDAQAVRQTIQSLPNVNFYNGLSNEGVLKLMLDSELLLLPTLDDTFGYVCLEAMAYGTAVLSTDVRALSEINTEETGFQISIPKDRLNRWIGLNEPPLSGGRRKALEEAYQAIEENLVRILREIESDPRILPVRARADYKKIKTFFSPDRHSQQLLHVYNQSLPFAANRADQQTKPILNETLSVR